MDEKDNSNNDEIVATAHLGYKYIVIFTHKDNSSDEHIFTSLSKKIHAQKVAELKNQEVEEINKKAKEDDRPDNILPWIYSVKDQEL